jgi:Domain of unknown function (DUF5916)
MSPVTQLFAGPCVQGGMPVLRSRWNRIGIPLLLAALAAASPLWAQSPEPLPEIRISRSAGEIAIDGQLGDPGWQGATQIDTFFETNPGDNVPPKVRTTAWLTYDDRFFYAAFDFEDDPKTVRAPLGDRDNVPSSTDYGGLILDTRNDGRTAVMMLVNPSNIQYDALTSDASGEDSSYDLFWDSATRITDRGWTLEIRVPFSSLRYDKADPQTWGVLLYRNRPRDFRYQMFSSRLPRDSNCFICNERKIVGLTGLPGGNHLVLAPYGTSRQPWLPAGTLGSSLESEPVEWDGGLDAKWTPNADTALDATINPDFSQIESDVAQIATNERFALFFPERRPFFLEGLDLFSTPIQAVYTRTITSPRWGLRSTGELLDTAYTLLVTQDRGGGSVIIPGPESSRLAPQNFASTVVVGRARHDLGRSFVSFLLTGREIEGGGHNRVAGPDFQWRPTEADTVTGQLLASDSRTPERPDLAGEWDGRSLSSHALFLSWDHNTRTHGWLLRLQDIGDDFRADAGFLPQVGFREAVGEASRRFYPTKGPFHRIRPYARMQYTTDQNGDLIFQRAFPGINVEGMWNGFAEVNYLFDRVRAGERLFDRQQLSWYVQMSPSLLLNDISFEGWTGEEVDFDNLRAGKGASIGVRATLRPTNHLELRLNGSRRWLDLAEGPHTGERLFTAEVARLRATYTFTSRAFLRLIGQQVRTESDPSLYTFEVAPEDKSFSGSALFAYKLNWQTVLFLGYGDERALAETTGRLERSGRELFLKISYAFQR